MKEKSQGKFPSANGGSVQRLGRQAHGSESGCTIVERSGEAEAYRPSERAENAAGPQEVGCFSELNWRSLPRHLFRPAPTTEPVVVSGGATDLVGSRLVAENAAENQRP